MASFLVIMYHVNVPWPALVGVRVAVFLLQGVYGTGLGRIFVTIGPNQRNLNHASALCLPHCRLPLPNIKLRKHLRDALGDGLR